MTADTPVSDLYFMGEGAWGITTVEQALSCLGVAENDGDVREVLDALMTMRKVVGPVYRKVTTESEDEAPDGWGYLVTEKIQNRILYTWFIEVGEEQPQLPASMFNYDIGHILDDEVGEEQP